MWAAGLRNPGVRVERDTRTVTGGVVAASLHTTVLRILELMVLTYGTMCSS